MRALYFLRVLFISIEFALILAATYLLTMHADFAQALADGVSINEDLLKYLSLVPVGIASWIFLESRKLIFEKENIAKLLVSWPDYWRLKTHLNATFIFAITFTLISFAPWFVKQHLSSGIGFTLFGLGIIGQISVAASIYMAGFRIQELAIDAPKA